MNIVKFPKSTIALVSEFPKDYQKKILKLAISAYLPSRNKSKVIEQLAKESNISRETIYEVLGAYIELLSIFLQSNDEEYNEMLTDFGFTPEFIKELPFVGNKGEIVANLHKNYSTEFGKLSFFKCRVDLSLGNSTLAKKIPNIILISMVKKNGKKYTIELDQKMFHKLRFSIAMIFYELYNIKNK